MTIVEALRLSKDTGRKFSRPGSQWVRWAGGMIYSLSVEEVLADDWEDEATFVPKLTGGRWGAAHG